MPVMARTLSRIASRRRARSAMSLVRHWTSTAGASSPPGVVIATAAMSPALKPGSCSIAPSMSRPVVLAVDDDDVLGAADDQDIAVGHVSNVSGFQPSVIETGFGRFRIAEL